MSKVKNQVAIVLTGLTLVCIMALSYGVSDHTIDSHVDIAGPDREMMKIAADPEYGNGG